MTLNENKKPNLIVLTDIGGDPDDMQSLIRLMLYSNEFNIKALIATSTLRHGTKNHPELIYKVIDGYEKVYPNLKLHAKGYPEPDYLKSIVFSGDEFYGMKFVGDRHDTKASEKLIEIISESNETVNVAVWGGTTTLAQALYKAKATMSQKSLEHFISKLRVYAIDEQDDTGSYVRTFNPVYIRSLSEKGSFKSAFRGMYLGGDEQPTSKDWINNNVKLDHGELGSLYPMDTHTSPNPYGCLKEGDTPSWFFFLNNGLNDPKHPQYGGWGGRFIFNNEFCQDSEDNFNGELSAKATVFRFRSEFQNDFAARMDWCKSPTFSIANHNPVIVTDCNNLIELLPNQSIKIDASKSFDPDGNNLKFKWWQYFEAGDGNKLEITADKCVAIIKAPNTKKECKEHIILQATDDGTPNLTSYKRIIIKLKVN